LVIKVVKNKVAWLTMNRPEALNSLNTELAQELVLKLTHCGENPDVNVVVLTGKARRFAQEEI
jgi:enoyl-CoA hydratase